LRLFCNHRPLVFAKTHRLRQISGKLKSRRHWLIKTRKPAVLAYFEARQGLAGQVGHSRQFETAKLTGFSRFFSAIHHGTNSQ
jgi:hypothetical protein